MLINFRTSLMSLLCFVLFCCTSKFVLCEELKSEDIYKKALPSVVTLTVNNKEGIALGTAFFAIKEGIAVTAWHVVKGAKSITAKFANGEEFDVSGLIDKDEKRDVCLIRVKVIGTPLLDLIKDDPEIGSKSYIIGAPRGLDFSISDGLVNQVRTMNGVKYYQFSCAASPGNSGGPLINNNGKVLGVVSWQVIDGQNLNFAIPSSYVLGLDSSLPTQPWDQVKIQEKPKGTSLLTDEELDKVLADTFIFAYDWGTSDTLIKRYLEKNPLDKNIPTVPSIIYSTQKSIQILKPQLESNICTEYRENLRLSLLKFLDAINEACNNYILAITTVQKTRDWAGEPNNYISKVSACFSNLKPIPYNDILSCAKSKSFSDELPIDLKYSYGIIESKSGFKLAIDCYSRNPLYLVTVYEDGFAYKLGFRNEDKLLAVNNKSLYTLEDFKVIIKDNLGKRIEVQIERDGKKKTLSIKLPKELPTD